MYRLNRIYQKLKYKPHYIAWIVLISFTLVLLSIFTINYFNNYLEKSNNDFVNRLSTINNIVSNIPELLPASKQQISNAEEFSYSTFQAAQTIGENRPSGIPFFLRLPFSNSAKLHSEINDKNNTLDASKLSLIQLSQDTEYLLKFIFYAPSEDFIAYREDALLDDERIQRTKLGFQTIADNQSLSNHYRDDMRKALLALNQFESNKELSTYIDAIAEIQKNLVAKLNDSFNNEKLSINTLYQEALYQ